MKLSRISDIRLVKQKKASASTFSVEVIIIICANQVLIITVGVYCFDSLVIIPNTETNLMPKTGQSYLATSPNKLTL